MQQNNDAAIHELYAAWCDAEAESHRIFGEVNDDYAHPRYIEADKHAHDMLLKLLKLSPSLYGALVKLKIACQYEDYEKESQDPACTFIAPHAIVAAISDLETILRPNL